MRAHMTQIFWGNRGASDVVKGIPDISIPTLQMRLQSLGILPPQIILMTPYLLTRARLRIHLPPKGEGSWGSVI